MDYKEYVFASFDQQRQQNSEIITTEYDLLIEWAKLQPKSANKALEFAFKHLKPTKNFCRKITSYGLKHKIEKLSEQMKNYEYCGNLEFIIAACQHGFRVTVSRSGPNNYYFNFIFDLELFADLFDGGKRVQERADVKKRLTSNRRSWTKENKSYFAEVVKRHHLSRLSKMYEYEKVVPISESHWGDCVSLYDKVHELFWFADKYPPDGGHCINKELFIQRFGCCSVFGGSGANGGLSLQFADFEVEFVRSNSKIVGVYVHLPVGVTTANVLVIVNQWLVFHSIMGVKTLADEFWV